MRLYQTRFGLQGLCHDGVNQILDWICSKLSNFSVSIVISLVTSELAALLFPGFTVWVHQGTVEVLWTEEGLKLGPLDKSQTSLHQS